jgi:large subunit ribosomal protein L6
MSRIGKKPIQIPAGTQVQIDGESVSVKGPKGELKKSFSPEIKIEIREGQVFVSPKKETKNSKALWGLTRAIIFNMVQGVGTEYEKKLQLEGVGYRAALEGEDLSLQVGFSNSIKVKKTPGIRFLIEKNIITIFGIDKELVGQVAAKIRKIKPPEPYKGKGIRYVGEEVKRKAGKKVVAAAA